MWLLARLSRVNDSGRTATVSKSFLSKLSTASLDKDNSAGTRCIPHRDACNVFTFSNVLTSPGNVFIWFPDTSSVLIFCCSSSSWMRCHTPSARSPSERFRTPVFLHVSNLLLITLICRPPLMPSGMHPQNNPSPSEDQNMTVLCECGDGDR